MTTSGVTLLAVTDSHRCRCAFSHIGRARRPLKRAPSAISLGKCRRGDAIIRATRATTTATLPARSSRPAAGTAIFAPPSTTRCAGSHIRRGGRATAAAKAALTTSVSRASSSRMRRRRHTRRHSSRKRPSRGRRTLSLPTSGPDGSWLLDSSDSIGSPATYGTALATVFARRTLQAANQDHSRSASIAPAVGSPRSPSTTSPTRQQSCSHSPTPLAGAPATGNRRYRFSSRDRGAMAAGGRTRTLLPRRSIRRWRCSRFKRSGGGRTPRNQSSARQCSTRRSRSGRRYLVKTQLDDGSWNETTRPAGQTSYAQRVSTTAWALLALMETKAPK